MSSFKLPSSLSVYTVDRALAGYCAIVESDAEALEIDASRLRFVDPMGLCVLAAIVQKLTVRGVAVRLSGLDPDVFDYLERMDFLKQCRMDRGLSPRTRRERSGSLVEISRLTERNAVEQGAARLARAVVGQVAEDVALDTVPDEMSGKSAVDKLEMPLRYVFSELLENALTHGRGRGYRDAAAWIAAQYYPQSDKVRLAVVDDGCGFLESLRGHAALAADSHLTAMEAALKPRVSRNRELGLRDEPINQGVGLTVTRQIALQAGGTVALVSGDAWLADRADHVRVARKVSPWQGVAAYIEVRRAALQGVDLARIMRSLPGYAPVKGLKFDD